MASWNKATTSKDLPLQAVRDLLESMDEDRAELVLERDNAVRSGNLDSVLQCSKDLRLLHRDYLQGALKAALIRHSQMRQRVPGPEWPQYEFFKGGLAREAADAKLKEEAQDSADPFTTEAFTAELIRNELSARMDDEKTFLENLKRVAQKDGNSSLLRACRNELRLLRKDLLEGQMEITNFEQNNPPPVDLYAKTAEIMEARFRVVEMIRELAEDKGIISKSEES